ncbi:hypothetical protein Tco_0103483 [Tanacetum coccineum]
MDSEKEAQKSGKRLKRVAGSYATQKSPKKPKVMKSTKDVTKEEAAEYEKEKEELRLSLKIIPNDDSEVDYEPLSKKFPIISWEYQLLGKMEEKDMDVYKLTRADGSSSYHGDTQDFLRRLDKKDLNDLYSTNTLSVGSFRDERIVRANARAIRQRLYKSQFLPLGSSGLVHQEEEWIILNVHRLPGTEQANGEESLSTS